MNDDFLKKYKKQPRPEFARSLRLKLSHQGETKMRPARPILKYALTASLIAVLSMAAVPSARAQAIQAFENLSEIVFISIGPLPQNSEQPTIIEIRPGQFMNLEEARAQAKYPVLIPTWSPEGYTLADNEVSVTSLKNEVVGLNIKWQSEQEVIFLYVTPANEEGLTPPQGGDVIEMEVNGEAAFLFSSEFSISAAPLPDGTPGPDVVINQTTPIVSLSWIQDGVQYNLSGSLSAEDALKMAESMR